jgi:hypothetical protein
MPISPRHALLPSTALLALAACGGAPSAGDYASRGEDFITEGLDGQAERAGISFADPQCDDPPSTAVGTIFNCTATGSDGVVYTFTVTIVGRNRMELVSQPPLPSAGGDTTTPASTPAPTGSAAPAATVAPATTATTATTAAP